MILKLEQFQPTFHQKTPNQLQDVVGLAIFAPEILYVSICGLHSLTLYQDLSTERIRK